MTTPDNNRSNPGHATGAQAADALDQWLESMTASRRGGPAWPPDPPNGLAGNAESLASVAQRAHASIAVAEQKSGLSVPVDAIWEEIMNGAIVADSHVRRGRPRVDPYATIAGPRERPSRPIPAWLSGSHWAVSAVLIAALVVGILALYQSFAGTPGGPGDDPTINSGLAVGTPDSSPTIDTAANLAPIAPEECDVEPRSLEEVSALMQDPGELAPREYGPVQSVSEEDALEVSAAQRVYESCRRFGDTADRRAMDSPRLISEGMGLQLYDSIARNSASFEAYIETNRALSHLLLTDDDLDYFVISELAAPVDADGEHDLSDFYWQLMLPENIVELADGRIGGPLSGLFPSNYDEVVQAIFDLGRQSPVPSEFELVDYAVYVQDPTRDGRWVLDETLRLCASGCDSWYAQAESYYQSQVPILAPDSGATPGASPAAGADPDALWLQSSETVQCEQNETDPFPANPALDRPGAVENYLPVAEASETQRLDVASQHRLIGANCAADDSGMPSISTDIGIMPALDTEPVTQQQLETAIAIVEALPDDDPMAFIIEGEALPATASTGGPMASKSLVLLPEDVVLLPDGRVGGPLRAMIQTNHPEGVAGWIEHTGGMLDSMFVIFEDQDGVWALDELIPICIGECTSYWESYRIAPKATPVATPAAILSYRHS